MDISYTPMKKSWQIISTSLSQQLLDDLIHYKLPSTGEFREYATLETLIPYLDNTEKIKLFLAGLTDTVGSVAKSHRRFSDKFQIVSYEFKGKNFVLVAQLYDLFKQIGCIPDQVLWNHPNQHSGHDRYYRNWKKGFKVRVGLNDYMLYGKFMGLAKQLSAQANLKLQGEGKSTTQEKISRIDRLSCVHVDETSTWLPKPIRGYHFIHNNHFLAILGKLVDDNQKNELLLALSHAEQFVSPFTILTKRERKEIEMIVQSEPYLKHTTYKTLSVSLPEVIKLYEQDPNTLLWGNTSSDGFPIEKIMQGISFLFSSKSGKNIKGKRVLGNYMMNIYEHIRDGEDIQIDYLIPNRGTCMILRTDTHGCLIGYRNEEFTKTLLIREGEYDLKVREPSYEMCVELR